MCNACGNVCCGMDCFDACGCDWCECEDCHDYSDDDEGGEDEDFDYVLDRADRGEPMMLARSRFKCSPCNEGTTYVRS